MKTLVMNFLNATGKTSSVRLNSVKDTVEASAVNAAMDNMILKNIFTTSGGDLISKDGAYLTETNKETITL